MTQESAISMNLRLACDCIRRQAAEFEELRKEHLLCLSDVGGLMTRANAAEAEVARLRIVEDARNAVLENLEAVARDAMAERDALRERLAKLEGQ